MEGRMFSIKKDTNNKINMLNDGKMMNTIVHN